ncbi:MAG: 50S ribosomal protein L6 [Chlamydiae bacterium]|nr:50S ribosomal protein L6 [Chlamydiota bacterium]
MSRIGKQPIEVPKGVQVTIDGNLITVKGSKHELKLEILKDISVKLEDGIIYVIIENPKVTPTKFQGLYRSLIANMIDGVTKGFKKDLELKGVGYRAAVQGGSINLQLGFSHPTVIEIPKGLEVKVDKNVLVSIAGADKQLVGQFASTIHHLRKPEPYKGKGVHYVGQYVRRKAGKSASKK